MPEIYYATNNSNSDIDCKEMGVCLKAGETKEYREREAMWVDRTYKFVSIVLKDVKDVSDAKIEEARKADRDTSTFKRTSKKAKKVVKKTPTLKKILKKVTRKSSK